MGGAVFCLETGPDMLCTPAQSEQTSKLSEELAGPLRIMQEAARRIAKIAIESKMTVVEGAPQSLSFS